MAERRYDFVIDTVEKRDPRDRSVLLVAFGEVGGVQLFEGDSVTFSYPHHYRANAEIANATIEIAFDTIAGRLSIREDVDEKGRRLPYVMLADTTISSSQGMISPIEFIDTVFPVVSGMRISINDKTSILQ